MIASTAIAVLPVWRSPMISSRCPRPMAVIASMALMPVYRGSLTGWRCTTVGAWLCSPPRPLDARDAVAGHEDPADLLAGNLGREGLDVLAQRRGDLLGSDRQLRHFASSLCIRLDAAPPAQPASNSRAASSCRLTVPSYSSS